VPDGLGGVVGGGGPGAERGFGGVEVGFFGEFVAEDPRLAADCEQGLNWGFLGHEEGMIGQKAALAVVVCRVVEAVLEGLEVIVELGGRGLVAHKVAEDECRLKGVQRYV